MKIEHAHYRHRLNLDHKIRNFGTFKFEISRTNQKMLNECFYGIIHIEYFFEIKTEIQTRTMMHQIGPKLCVINIQAYFQS